jgi:hypothetical protein
MTAVLEVIPQLISHNQASLEDKLQEACKQVRAGLRTALEGAKVFGEVMLQAQKELKLNPDHKLYDWVRQTTGCKFGDTTLANWKRLALNWTQIVAVAGQEALNGLTVREALSYCKKTSRKSKKGTSTKPTGGRSRPSQMQAIEEYKSEVHCQADDKEHVQSEAPTSNGLTVTAHLAHVVSELDETFKCFLEPAGEEEAKQVKRLLDSAVIILDRLRKKLNA